VKREPVPSFGVEPLDGTAEEGLDESMDSKLIAKDQMEFLRAPVLLERSALLTAKRGPFTLARPTQ
jgi:hypothetical protein